MKKETIRKLTVCVAALAAAVAACALLLCIFRKK